MLNRRRQMQYVVFATERCIDVFEDAFPRDDRPRKAIDAVKLCIENDTEDNRSAAREAAHASYLAVCKAIHTAEHIDRAAYATARAADLAAHPTNMVVYAADAISSAFMVIHDTAHVAMKKITKKIFDYGISLSEQAGAFQQQQ